MVISYRHLVFDLLVFFGIQKISDDSQLLSSARIDVAGSQDSGACLIMATLVSSTRIGAASLLKSRSVSDDNHFISLVRIRIADFLIFRSRSHLVSSVRIGAAIFLSPHPWLPVSSSLGCLSASDFITGLVIGKQSRSPYRIAIVWVSLFMGTI